MPLERSARSWPEAPADIAKEPADPWNAAADGGGTLDLAQYPGALLLRVANVIHHESTAVYARKHGLTVPEWRILGRLHLSAPIKRSELCRISYIDKGQVTRILRDLTRRGLTSTRPAPDHKHRLLVDITPEGHALAERVFPDALAEQHKVLSTLTPEERRITYATLRKLLEAYGHEIPVMPKRPETS